MLVLENYIERIAAQSVSWYRCKKRNKQRASFLLRLTAVIFLTMGAVCPLLPPEWAGFAVEHLGYVLLLIGGCLLTLHNLFGLSDSWVRFISTAQAIEASMDLLRMDWLDIRFGGRPAGDGVHHAYVEKGREFLIELHKTIEKETLDWAAELKLSIEALDHKVELKGGP